MAGLPVFLIGLMTVLFAGVTLLTVMASGLTVTRPLPIALLFVAGMVLIALGLGLRAGKAALVPLAALLTMANAGLTVAMGSLWMLPLQAMILLVTISGLRGWWWLRNHPA
ncbi:MAG: hypothetical protein RLZZ437_885 [Pseudomonadota bacterium]|jgi:hypothetical protein